MTSAAETLPTAKRDLTAHGFVALMVYAAAVPWELFQRVPYTGATLTKVAAAACILATLASVVAGPRRAYRRTGLEWPIALFAFAAAASFAFTIDRGATLSRLMLYVTYCCLFFAAAVLLRDMRRARALVSTYVASSALLGLYTLVCYAGWLWPTFWGTSLWPHQRLLLEYQSGVPLRMAGASNDFNAAAMTFAVAFAAALFLFDRNTLTRGRRIALFAAQALLLGGIAIAMSRSGLLLCLILMAVRISCGSRRTAAVAVVCSGLVLLVLLAARPAFFMTLLHRMEGGVAYNDPSLRGRTQVYGIAFTLLREYGFLGSGLGTVDTALAKSAFADDAIMTVHSMPLALSIELGVLGALAYGWLWWQIGWTCYRRGTATHSAHARRHAAAFGAMATCVFGMTLVQPFATSPLYPLLLAIGFGPIAEASDDSPVSQSRTLRRFAVATLSLCAIVIAWNAATYQQTARTAWSYAAEMEAGFACGERAQFSDAASHYAVAAHIATDTHLDRRPYKTEAFDVVDIAPLYATLGVLHENPGPSAVAQFALGRACLASEDLTRASESIRTAVAEDPGVSFATYDLAEGYWRAGRYSEGITQYAQAAAYLPTPPTRQDLRRLRKLEQRMRTIQPATLAKPDYRELNYFEELLQTANTQSLAWPCVARTNALAARAQNISGAAALEAVDCLRRLGRWKDAADLCARILKDDSKSAGALFGLGIDAELRGDRPAALTEYRAALEVLPNYRDAQRAVNRLENQSVNGTTP